MASYIITEEQEITRNEGDSNDVELSIASDVINLDLYPNCKFQVRYESDVERTMALVISKATGGNGVVISGQSVTVTIDPSDTTGKAGSGYRWEIQFDDGTDIYTIMRGPFILDREIIV